MARHRPTETWDVFISHATSRDIDYAMVHKLKKILEACGLTVFLDRCVMPTGNSVVQFLDQATGHCRSAVLVWTIAASESIFVAQERKELKKRLGWSRIVLLRLDRGLRLPPGLPDGNIFEVHDSRQLAALAPALCERLADILRLSPP